MARRRSYSDNDKATVLASLDANGGNLKRTARETGIPVSTVRSWRDGVGVSERVEEFRPIKRAELSTLFEDEIYAIFDLLPEKRKEATYQQLATSLGIYTDKMRLLRNLPTEIVGLMPELISALRAANKDPVAIFQRMVQRAHEEAGQRGSD